jgi:hypothetical protein
MAHICNIQQAIVTHHVVVVRHVCVGAILKFWCVPMPQHVNDGYDFVVCESQMHEIATVAIASYDRYEIVKTNIEVLNNNHLNV